MENSIIIHNISTEDLFDKIRLAIREELSLTQQNANVPRYLTRQEVASLLKVTLPTLHLYTKAGIIKACRLGTRVLYLESDVLNAVKEIPIRNKRR